MKQTQVEEFLDFNKHLITNLINFYIVLKLKVTVAYL